jgi:tetratricopeptide (TPR) repeat protein/transcriptional regulator with XRE-family HTH domain
MESIPRSQPNALLRQQRLMRGWSLQHVVEQLCSLCQEEDDVPGVTKDMVSKWERGERKPSRFYQTKLCLLYNTTAVQLGFLDTSDLHEPSPSNKTSTALTIPSIIPDSSRAKAIDEILSQSKDEVSATLATQLLSLSGKQLATLATLGWTQENILHALQIVLQGEMAMATMKRRQVLQLGASILFLGGIDLPTREHPSFEERAQLTRTLGEGIAAGWTLFHIASPAQVLAVGRSQLALLQQVHSDIYPTILPMLYSGVYRLNGAALHFQGHYDDAHQAHQKAYIAALDDGDVWNMAQSRSWQAYGLKALGNYDEALQVADAAVRLVSQQTDTESIRLQARLLAFGAENAALIGDTRGSETRLDTSERLLEHFQAPHEEFDHASWLQQAGMCALHLEQNEVAVMRLQQALNELPPQWALRYVSTAVPLAKAYARISELDEALKIVEATTPIVRSVQAPTLTQEFQSFIQGELPKRFPDNERCRTITAEAQRQLTAA